MQPLTKATVLVATLSLFLLPLAGCRKTEGGDAKADASASVASGSTVSSATVTSSDAGAATSTKAKIGGVALADFSLENKSELDKVLKPLGWKPIMGCGEATFVGRAVTCTYGERPASVKIERKLPVKKKSEGTYEIGPYTYANAVVVTAGTTSLIITAGFDGKIADAQAILDAIYDKSGHSIGGNKIATIADDKALEKALEPKVFTGNRSSSSFSVDVALRTATISTHVGDTITPAGAKLEDATGARIGVVIKQKDGTDTAGEKKLLDAVLDH